MYSICLLIQRSYQCLIHNLFSIFFVILKVYPAIKLSENIVYVIFDLYPVSLYQQTKLGN